MRPAGCDGERVMFLDSRVEERRRACACLYFITIVGRRFDSVYRAEREQGTNQRLLNAERSCDEATMGVLFFLYVQSFTRHNFFFLRNPIIAGAMHN